MHQVLRFIFFTLLPSQQLSAIVVSIINPIANGNLRERIRLLSEGLYFLLKKQLQIRYLKG